VNSKKRALKAKTVCYSKFYSGLIKQNFQGIELYWALMILAMSEYLKVGSEIEPPQHYAAKIKELDEYFGTIA
jgi:hypothetical protein